MASNEKLIIDRYSDSNREENRANRSRADSLEFHYTKKYICQFVTLQSSVIEIGCGTGYYGMFLADKCKSYLGVDITPNNINTFNEKIKNSNCKNVTAYVADATDLKMIEDEEYDVVLVLGPMYHLPTLEKKQVIKESKRICKNGGIIFFAYINKIGPYIGACIRSPEIYPNKNANELILKQGIDDIRPEIYFYNTPEEMEKMANESDLHVLKNVGVDFLQNSGIVNNMSDEQFEAWIELSDFMSESPSCTGFSCHAVLICKKD